MIHAKRLSHPWITCEARVLMVRRAGVGPDLVLDSERSPHVQSSAFPTDRRYGCSTQSRVSPEGISSQIVRRFDTPVMTIHPGATMKSKAVQSLLLSCILLSTNVRRSRGGKAGASRTQ